MAPLPTSFEMIQLTHRDISQVMGAFLYKGSSQHWSDAAARLQRAGRLTVNGQNLFSQLRISYDGLDMEERQLFVDIACMFLGYTVREARLIWDRCEQLQIRIVSQTHRGCQSCLIFVTHARARRPGWSAEVGLQTLLERCLVSLEVVTDHDQVQTACCKSRLDVAPCWLHDDPADVPIRMHCRRYSLVRSRCHGTSSGCMISFATWAGLLR